MTDDPKDAPETDDDAEAGAPEPELDEDGNPIEAEKPKSKKKLIIIGVILLLLIGGGAGAYFMGMLDGVLGKGEVSEGEEGEEHSDSHGAKKDSHAKKKDDGHGGGHGDSGGHAPPGGVAFLEIPPITVGLLTEDDSPRFLRLTVQLEMASEDDKAMVESIMPRVIDQFQTYLRELRVRDLRGSAGMYRLQMELLRRVNRAASPVEVQDVLFQEILIQ